MRTIHEAARAGHTAPLQLLMLPAAYTGPGGLRSEKLGSVRRCASAVSKSM